MRYEQFRRFLETTHAGPSGKPLSSRAAGDYASRYRRIEELLGCDLDQEGGDGDALAPRIEPRAGDLATAASGASRPPGAGMSNTDKRPPRRADQVARAGGAPIDAGVPERGDRG